MAAIAVHIGRVGRGEVKRQLSFRAGAPDYRYSESAVFKAYNKAMNPQPAVNAEVSRKEDTARLEQLYLNLQRSISSGDPRAIDTAVRVLAHKAKLNGYAVEPEQVGNYSSFQINIHLGGEAEE